MLIADGSDARGASRSSEISFDWEDESTWAPALLGMDAVYIAYYPDLTFPGAAETVGRLTDMAVAAGAKRLVLLSLRNDEAAHRAEQRVRDSGADWTILRCAFFNQNFSEMFAEVIAMGRLAMPAGESTEPFIDANDIADVAATALTDDSHAGQIYELTGPGY